MYEDESQDAEQVNADTVLGRIEEFVLSWLTILVDDDAPAPAFDVLRRTENNVTLVAEPGASAALFHGDQRVIKRLTNTGARSYVQILCVLLFCQTLLQEGRTATVREFWYHCKSNHADIFRTQADADNAVMDASGLLGVARHQLGLLASARGFVVGPLRFSRTELEEEGEAWVDCSQRPRLIDSSWITAHVQVDVSRCRYILVVEKESVFRRLWEDGLTATLGGIVMITGKGYPDLATRACVKRLSTAAANLTVIGMCDLNPHGVALLLTYRVGSARSAQSGDYAVKLRWMGLRPSQASNLDLDDRVWQE